MSGSAPHLLVVDPKAAHRALLARRLTAEGYAMTTTDSAGAAIAMLHRGDVDLVLAELAMPVFDGIALTQRLRATPAWCDLPVILISGRSENDGIVRALAGGADDVVVKPFHFEVLVARIARQLERARNLAALRADMVKLDARVVERAIAFGELNDRFQAREAERLRA
ncbi:MULTISPECIES: response regulator transcription factor [Sphingomonas]|uniref:response regulator transcription factor n=1 Tax=Sphingomonas TaxID=13687 RepID=UPI000DEEF75B|nr:MULTISPECIES: response regulator [Sphingomonas]